MGDFADVGVPGPFSLAVLALDHVRSAHQEAKVACVENAARHLVPGGRFVIETWVPDLDRLSASGSAVGVRRLTPTAVSLGSSTRTVADTGCRW